jgi:signal transduction histidine kinase/ActR/RegA family two-component response regulator
LSSLGRQLLWASFWIGAPPVAVVSIVSSWVAAEQIDSGLHERLHAAARGAEIAIRVEVDRIRARAAAVAKNPVLQEALAQGQQHLVLGLAEQAIDVVSVDRATIVDSSGRVLARGHLPTRDGDLWVETVLESAGQERSAVGSAGGGVGAYVAVPISAPNQPAAGTLIVQKTFDYATLRELERQFGLDFSAWDGDRLQATTLRSTEHIEEAERARRALSAAGALYVGTAHYFAQAHFDGSGLGSGTLLLAIDTKTARTLEARLMLLYAVVAVGMVALTVVGAFLSARRIVRPIRRLVRALEAAAQGQIETPLQVEGPNEIQELAASFDHMLGKRREAEDGLRRTQAELEERVIARTEALRQTEEHLRQARQLEALGRLAGGVAHDFNNVLTVIAGNAELLAINLNTIGAPANAKTYLNGIQHSASHAAELIRQLMAFSREQVVAPVVLDLGRTVLDLEKMLERLCAEDVALSISVDGGAPPILADPTQIGQILVNLVVNAEDALPAGGSVRVAVYPLEAQQAPDSLRAGLAPGLYVCLEVADDGVGMSPETARRIFEPFFTTKAPGKGTGMGLATVHGIVKQSGAHVDVETRPGHGAKFRILFPAVVGGVVRTPPALAQTVPRGHETILLCEDEEGVRAVTASFLESSDYDVLIASSGREALELAETRRDIALLLTDVGMPEMNGVELATRLCERRPDVKVLYMSGYTASVLDSRPISGAEDQLLTKPFTRTELLSHIRRVLDRPTHRTRAS